MRGGKDRVKNQIGGGGRKNAAHAVKQCADNPDALETDNAIKSGKENNRCHEVNDNV